ncbi:MAG: HutD/Ves family protein [Casimicrobium sp.]
MTDSQINVVRLGDVSPQPWKNGGGVTRELLAWPDARDWAIRVSVADIEQDGPFSWFASVTRHFAVLSGNGVALEDIGELRAGDAPVVFEGDKSRECRLLDGPTRDLNVMIRRDFGSGMLRLHERSDDLVMAHGATIHGLFDPIDGVLQWSRSTLALPEHTAQMNDRIVFHLAFWSHEALQWAVANP